MLFTLQWWKVTKYIYSSTVELYALVFPWVAIQTLFVVVFTCLSQSFPNFFNLRPKREIRYISGTQNYKNWIMDFHH